MRHSFSLQGRAVNGRQISIALPNDQNGVIMYWGNAEHWNVRGSTVRGGWRHAASHRVLARLKEANPGYRMSTDTARLLSLGGVKSSGASKLMTPLQIERAKAANPLIEDFGCNDPAFFAGHTYVSHMLSEDPIDRSRSNSRPYNLQVVRRPLAHSGFSADDLSDPEKIAEFSEVNRYRSQLETLSKKITTLEAGIARKPDAKKKKDLDNAFADVAKLTGKEFKTSLEVKEFVDQTLAEMRTKGFSTVSEQTIPVGQEVIPIATPMQQSAHIIGARNVGVGLLIDGISYKMFTNPFVGGRAAAGCGGWISTEYTVKRIEDDQWVDDCTLNLIPEHHVEFHNAEHSQLKACYEEWLECDITKFDFTYEGLQRIANGNETAEDQ